MYSALAGTPVSCLVNPSSHRVLCTVWKRQVKHLAGAAGCTSIASSAVRSAALACATLPLFLSKVPAFVKVVTPVAQDDQALMETVHGVQLFDEHVMQSLADMADVRAA
jgi:hypothetical protein